MYMYWLVGLALVAVLLTAAEPLINDEQTLEMEWQNFKAKFGKIYQPENEEEYRWVGKYLRGDCNY